MPGAMIWARPDKQVAGQRLRRLRCLRPKTFGDIDLLGTARTLDGEMDFRNRRGGKQGGGKSTAHRIMAGDENFGDGEILGEKAIDAVPAIRRAWPSNVGMKSNLHPGDRALRTAALDALRDDRDQLWADATWKRPSPGAKAA